MASLQKANHRPCVHGTNHAWMMPCRVTLPLDQLCAFIHLSFVSTSNNNVSQPGSGKVWKMTWFEGNHHSCAPPLTLHWDNRVWQLNTWSGLHLSYSIFPLACDDSLRSNICVTERGNSALDLDFTWVILSFLWHVMTRWEVTSVSPKVQQRKRFVRSVVCPKFHVFSPEITMIIENCWMSICWCVLGVAFHWVRQP